MNSTGGAVWSDMAVKNCLATNVSRVTQIIRNGDEVIESLSNVAELLKESNQDAEFQRVYEAAQLVATSRHSIKIHKYALKDYSNFQYRATGETTDFKDAIISSSANRLSTTHQYDINQDESLARFKELIEPRDDEHIDDDIVIERPQETELARNNICPITLKNILDIDEPVKDQLGFVYEKNAVYGLFANHGAIQCPVAGTTHRIARADLVPARAVIAAKKRKLKNIGNKKAVIDDDDDEEDVLDL